MFIAAPFFTISFIITDNSNFSRFILNGVFHLMVKDTNSQDNNKKPPVEKSTSTKIDTSQELEKFKEYKKTRDAELREELISANLNIVYPIARKYLKKDLNLEDLIQVGYIGLIKAVDNFDPDRGVKFFTYANHCIMGEIRHYIRDSTDSIKRPRWLKKLNRQVSSFVEEYVQNNHKLPTIKKISSSLNISEEGIIEILKSGKVLSLDQVSEQRGDQIYYSRIRSVRVENFKLPIEDRIMIFQSLEKLKNIEKKIIYLFFYMDLTQTKIAKDLGLSQKKVSRVLHKTLNKIKEMLPSRHSFLW